MHRRGTSALAGVLGLLGARLPARLLSAGRGQALAEWERRIVALGIAEPRNDEILPRDRRYNAVHITVTKAIFRAFGLVEFKMAVDVR